VLPAVPQAGGVVPAAAVVEAYMLLQWAASVS
jgi:hypothetical protein